MIGPSSRSRGHVVRGGADQLHAAVEGLVVGPGALEARQERVVDVDRLARQRAAGVVGEHLHVARQHHQVDARARRRARAAAPRRRPWSSGVTGTWWKGTPYDAASGSQSGWLDTTPTTSICSDSAAPPEQQVVEAVAELRDQDQRPVRRVGGPQLPGHGEPLGDRRRTPPAATSSRRRRPVDGEPHPHEEPVLGEVVELLALQDVAAVLDQEAADGVHDARPVGAGQGEDEGRGRARSVMASVVLGRGRHRCVNRDTYCDTQHGCATVGLCRTPHAGERSGASSPSTGP